MPSCVLRVRGTFRWRVAFYVCERRSGAELRSRGGDDVRMWRDVLPVFVTALSRVALVDGFFFVRRWLLLGWSIAPSWFVDLCFVGGRLLFLELPASCFWLVRVVRGDLVVMDNPVALVFLVVAVAGEKWALAGRDNLGRFVLAV